MPRLRKEELREAWRRRLESRIRHQMRLEVSAPDDPIRPKLSSHRVKGQYVIVLFDQNERPIAKCGPYDFGHWRIEVKRFVRAGWREVRPKFLPDT